MDAPRRQFLKLAAAGVAAAGWKSAGGRAQMQPATSHQPVYDVRKFGATGNGTTIDTMAINHAIEAASSARGGMVYFGPGTYASYSIRLKSNVTLYLDQGAIIVAAEPAPEGAGGRNYDPPEPNVQEKPYQDFGHSHWHNSLIWGEDIHHVSIVGPGLIWGKGLMKTESSDKVKGAGNKAIALKNCHQVLLRDFCLLEGGWFALLLTGVDNLTVDNLTLDTNRDGIDLDCCKNVRLSNCTINSPWDDSICPKSSLALGYPRSTENVTITNCYITGAYQLGTLLDGTFKKFSPEYLKQHRSGINIELSGIKFGSESNGGFKNIAISNCIFEGCHGFCLESVDGSLLEDISISNITMRDISSAPFFVRLGRRMRAPAGTALGEMRRILIDNVVCSNSASGIWASLLIGLAGHCIQDVKFSNIFIQHQGGGTREQANFEPPELETGFPNLDRWAPIPAQGFFLRHIRNIDMSHIEIASLGPDCRPAFVLEDVKEANLFRVDTPRVEGIPAVALRNVEQFGMYSSRGVPDTKLDHVVDKTL
jgi:polygalacturonase